MEFGTSLGLSTIHLASAVRDNGTGRVVTTELSAAKVAAARSTFAEVGLDDVITVLEGDATQTLADINEPVGFVLLDGWKDLYVPVVQVLEPRLREGGRSSSPTTRAWPTRNPMSPTSAIPRMALWA